MVWGRKACGEVSRWKHENGKAYEDLTEDGSEAGEADGDEPKAEGPNRLRRVIL